MAFDAFLLAFTNIVAIQVAGSVVMWFGGFRGALRTTPVDAFKRNLLSGVVLCALAVVLAIHLREVIGARVYEALLRRALDSAASHHSGAYLTDVRVQRVAGRALVVAVYRTPTPFTPQEVGALEPKLPLMPGANGLDLRVRSVPVIVASRAGYVLSSDPTEHDQPQ